MTRPTHFEDFRVGARGTWLGPTVHDDEIAAFTRRFAPRPVLPEPGSIPADSEARPVALEWHVAALTMRMMADALLAGSAGLGAPGVEEVDWLLPVYGGDTLSLTWHVMECKASRSRPHMGLVRCAFTVSNQAGQTVMTQSNSIMFARRETAS